MGGKQNLKYFNFNFSVVRNCVIFLLSKGCGIQIQRNLTNCVNTLHTLQNIKTEFRFDNKYKHFNAEMNFVVQFNDKYMLPKVQ